MMNRLIFILLMFIVVVLGQQKTKYPQDFTPQARKTLAEEMADSAKAVVLDSIAASEAQLRSDIKDTNDVNLGSDRLPFNSKSFAFGVANTTALAALTDTNRVYVRGIGEYIYKSSGYSNDGYVIVTATGVGSGTWVLKEYLEQKILRPEWYGAMRDGSTDDATAFQTTITNAISKKVRIKLSSGTYQIESGSVANLGWKQQLIIEGNGMGYADASATIINCDASDFIHARSTSAASSIQIKNMSILSDTTTALRLYTAIELDTCENSLISHVLIKGFKYGIDYNYCGQTKIEQCDIRYCNWNIKGSGHSDGIQLDGGVMGYADSVCVEYANSWGSIITGTEISGKSGGTSKSIAIKLNGYVTLFENGGRHENIDSTVYQIDGQGNLLTALGTSYLKGTGSGILARIPATGSYLTLIEPNLIEYATNGDSTIITSNLGQGNVAVFTSQPKNNEAGSLVVYDIATGKKFRPGFRFQNVWAHATPASNVNNVEKLYLKHRRTGTTDIDGISFVQQTNDTTFWENFLTDNTDVRYQLNILKPLGGSGFGRMPTARTYISRQDVILTSGKITRDTLIINANDDVYGFDVSCQFASDSLISIEPYSYNKATGQMIATLYHPKVNSLSGKVFYIIYVQAKKDDY